MPIDPAFQGLTPIEWVHVPKTGSSFINTLIHIPGVCPGLSEDLFVSEKRYHVKSHVLETFMRRDHVAENCNPDALDIRQGRMLHSSIESVPGYEAGKGRFMIMMRQPEQRTISDLTDTDGKQPSYSNLVLAETVLAFQGLVTKMLGRHLPENISPWNGTGAEGLRPAFDTVPPTFDELAKAEARLRNDFSFIGITEQWSMSMCLFNKMFSQKCRALQFGSAHGGELTHYDTEILNGWHDPFDTVLYEIALEKFNTNLKKYNVTKTSCNLCLQEAGLAPMFGESFLQRRL
jgi:hypothetical protein